MIRKKTLYLSLNTIYMKLSEAIETNKNAILLRSGILFDVFNPNMENVNIQDIAHALSNICRYGGHSPKFYSVAQHSVLCSYQEGTPTEQLEFLMHDSSEAYLADVPSPIKKNLPNYIKIEESLLEVIFFKFSLNYPLSDKVKQVDSELLSYEFKNFFEIPNKDFQFWSPEDSKARFLERFNELYQLVIDSLDGNPECGDLN